MRNICRNYARTERNAKADSNRGSAITETDGWGALAADGDTIIASKAYVDAMDQTKQDKNDRVTETWANSTADHSSTTKYPSMYTLNSAVGAGTSALDGNNADSETGVSAGAAADNTKIGMPVVKVTETDGIVTAELGAITDKGLAANAVTEAKINNGAVTTDKIADDAVTTGKIANSNVTMGKTNFVVHEVVGDQPNEITDLSWLAATNNENNKAEKALYNANAKPEAFVPTVGAVNGLLLRQGTAPKDWTAHSDDWDITDPTNAVQEALFEKAGGTSRQEWDAARPTDNYVPTVAAVEKRIQRAETTASGNYADKNLSNLTTAGNTVIDGRIDTKINALDATGVDGSSDAATTANRGKPVVAISQADGIISAELGQVKEAGIEDSAVTSAKIADGTIVNADISSSAAIDFSKMNAGLSSVNVAGSTYNSSCTAANPCVLTYFDGHYEWTAMDTEGVNAVN